MDWKVDCLLRLLNFNFSNINVLITSRVWVASEKGWTSHSSQYVILEKRIIIVIKWQFISDAVTRRESIQTVQTVKRSVCLCVRVWQSQKISLQSLLEFSYGCRWECIGMQGVPRHRTGVWRLILNCLKASNGFDTRQCNTQF